MDVARHARSLDSRTSAGREGQPLSRNRLDDGEQVTEEMILFARESTWDSSFLEPPTATLFPRLNTASVHTFRVHVGFSGPERLNLPGVHHLAPGRLSGGYYHNRVPAAWYRALLEALPEAADPAYGFESFDVHGIRVSGEANLRGIPASGSLDRVVRVRETVREIPGARNLFEGLIHSSRLLREVYMTERNRLHVEGKLPLFYVINAKLRSSIKRNMC